MLSILLTSFLFIHSYIFLPLFFFFFFFNDTATTEIYTLSLHDALPISRVRVLQPDDGDDLAGAGQLQHVAAVDRKSTRLNSSHLVISYAVFCLKKKKKKKNKVYVLRCKKTVDTHITEVIYCCS